MLYASVDTPTSACATGSVRGFKLFVDILIIEGHCMIMYFLVTN